MISVMIYTEPEPASLFSGLNKTRPLHYIVNLQAEKNHEDGKTHQRHA